MKPEVRGDDTNHKTVMDDYMKIQPGDSPAIVLLKKLATIDSTELKKIQEDLKAEKKH